MTVALRRLRADDAANAVDSRQDRQVIRTVSNSLATPREVLVGVRDRLGRAEP